MAEPNILKPVTSEWEHDESAGQVPCHSRMVGGVLCRWWGRADPPPGVAVIDAAVSDERRAAAPGGRAWLLVLPEARSGELPPGSADLVAQAELVACIEGDVAALLAAWPAVKGTEVTIRKDRLGVASRLPRLGLST